MGISLKQAFAFVPTDRHWVSKVLIGGLLLFFPASVFVFPGLKRLIIDPINYYFLTLYCLLVLTGCVAICGYFFKVVHNRIVHENGRLPSWKFFSYYIYIGIKSYLGGFLFSIPFLIVMSILLLFAPMSLSLNSLPFVLAACVLHVIYTAFYIMLALNFSLDFKVASFLNIKKAYSLIRHNLLNYVILVFDCLLVSVCSTILLLMLIHGQILALLLPFFSFYVCLIYADLFAQFEVNLQGEGSFKEHSYCIWWMPKICPRKFRDKTLPPDRLLQGVGSLKWQRRHQNKIYWLKAWQWRFLNFLWNLTCMQLFWA